MIRCLTVGATSLSQPGRRVGRLWGCCHAWHRLVDLPKAGHRTCIADAFVIQLRQRPAPEHGSAGAVAVQFAKWSYFRRVWDWGLNLSNQCSPCAENPLSQGHSDQDGQDHPQCNSDRRQRHPDLRRRGIDRRRGFRPFRHSGLNHALLGLWNLPNLGTNPSVN